MNVLVTSGGTVEKIDEVRSITNMATGRLGSLIADAFAAESRVDDVYYVCGKAAIRPASDSVKIMHVEGVSDLEDALKKTLATAKIDIIVHGMAVSDYRIRSVTSVSALADLALQDRSITGNQDRTAASAELASMMWENMPDMRTGGKIGSDIDDMLLVLERTPKIISLFSELSPQSTLVGFKLLHNVPKETLIDEGFRILTKNGCSFVLANDLIDIEGERHLGYLIDKDKRYVQCSTKQEIAAAIVSGTIGL